MNNVSSMVITLSERNTRLFAAMTENEDPSRHTIEDGRLTTGAGPATITTYLTEDDGVLLMVTNIAIYGSVIRNRFEVSADVKEQLRALSAFSNGMSTGINYAHAVARGQQCW